MIIGITGSFGTGKSTVALMLKSKGCKVINADKLYHGLIKPKTPLYNKVLKQFGTADRKKLKKIVFKDSKKLAKLNRLTHPTILSKIRKIVNKSKQKHIVIDAPLLIEAKALNMVDKLIVVKASRKNQIKRLIKKHRYSKNQIINIIRSQMPLNKKLKYADYIIDNNKDIKNTRKQVNKIWQAIN